MTYEEIGKIKGYIPVIMHKNLEEIYKEKFGEAPSPEIYSKKIRNWGGKTILITSYSTNSNMYKAKHAGTWNLYPEYIDSLATKEEYPEYFL
ncbi:MAG: hypothetical protein J7L15_03655 [Clostridiales bacterium]|nr:hypothetical protein [Clostridiales bacterium]